jgi:hypothetical protein
MWAKFCILSRSLWPRATGNATTATAGGGRLTPGGLPVKPILSAASAAALLVLAGGVLPHAQTSTGPAAGQRERAVTTVSAPLDGQATRPEPVDLAAIQRIKDEGPAAVAGHGHGVVSDRRLRAAPHELARHPGGRRPGQSGAWATGACPMCGRSLGAVRPRLVEREVQRIGRGAHALPPDCISACLDAGHDGRSQPRWIAAPIRNDQDMTTWTGKLKGKIVLVRRCHGGSRPVHAARPAIHRPRADRPRGAAR